MENGDTGMRDNRAVPPGTTWPYPQAQVRLPSLLAKLSHLLEKVQDPRREPFPNSEAATEHGGHQTCPASGHLALGQDVREPRTKNGPFLHRPRAQSPLHKMPLLGLPGSSAKAPEGLATKSEGPGPSWFPAVFSLQPAPSILCGGLSFPACKVREWGSQDEVFQL